MEAKAELKENGMDVRVVSMPCVDLFEDQSEDYKRSVLPEEVTNRVSVEAASTFGWSKYASKNIGMTSFGASAPAGLLFEKFGITKDAIVEALQ